MENYENVVLLPPNVMIQKIDSDMQQLPDLAQIGGIQLSVSESEGHLSLTDQAGTSQQLIITTAAQSPSEHEQKVDVKRETTGKKRNSLTIEKKIEIIQRHEKGETQRALSLEYQVGRTTISDILRRKYKFFKFMSLQTDKNSDNIKKRRTLRRTSHQELEVQLLDWYNTNREQGQHISGPMISQKATELHRELGYKDNFTASNGWLDRFKIRNGIKLCGLREVKSESDISAVAPFRAEMESLANWYNLTLDQIYNADETDLFFKMMPNPDADSNEVKASVRAYRERMTVLACGNATGHKLPLVVVGRGKRSRTFTSQEVKTLPVQYYSQETAWMDHEIFRNWFHNQFVPTVRQHLRSIGLPETAVLLIDRSPSHPSDQYLRSEDGFFFVQYFPSKVKSLIQPMEQGIIRDMKRYYRRELLTELINKNLTINEFHKNLSIKDAIRYIAKGWDFVSEECIRRCYHKLFPQQDENMQMEFIAAETTITTEAFVNLIKNIPECVDYGMDRVEEWLNCDEAEPKRMEKIKLALKPEENIVFVDVQNSNNQNQYTLIEGSEEEDSDLIEESESESVIQEKIQFQQQQTVAQPIHQSIAPQIAVQTSPILSHVQSSHLNPHNIQIPQSSHQQLIPQNHHQISGDGGATTILTYTTAPMEESNELKSNQITTKNAFDALNVLLKFMKNDPESRYKDVIFLTDLKKKIKKKLNDESTSSPIKMERDFS